MIQKIKRIAETFWNTKLNDKEAILILKDYPNIIKSYYLQQRLWDKNRK